METKTFTTKDLAEAGGVGVQNIARWVQRGQLTPLPAPTHRRVQKYLFGEDMLEMATRLGRAWNLLRQRK